MPGFEKFKKYGYVFTKIAICKQCGQMAPTTGRRGLCVDCIGVIRRTNSNKYLRKHRKKINKDPELKEEKLAEQRIYYDRWYIKMMKDPERYREYRKGQNKYYRNKLKERNEASLRQLKQSIKGTENE